MSYRLDGECKRNHAERIETFYDTRRIAKELGMKFMDVAGHVRSKDILVTKRISRNENLR